MWSSITTLSLSLLSIITLIPHIRHPASTVIANLRSKKVLIVPLRMLANHLVYSLIPWLRWDLVLFAVLTGQSLLEEFQFDGR